MLESTPWRVSITPPPSGRARRISISVINLQTLAACARLGWRCITIGRASDADQRLLAQLRLRRRPGIGPPRNPDRRFALFSEEVLQAGLAAADAGP